MDRDSSDDEVERVPSPILVGLYTFLHSLMVTELLCCAQRFHPLTVLNEYLLSLNASDYASVVITHDDIWCSVLKQVNSALVGARHRINLFSTG
jgi:hypothetical protein